MFTDQFIGFLQFAAKVGFFAGAAYVAYHFVSKWW